MNNVNLFPRPSQAIADELIDYTIQSISFVAQNRREQIENLQQALNASNQEN
jgi:hypothetical protein